MPFLSVIVLYAQMSSLPADCEVCKDSSHHLLVYNASLNLPVNSEPLVDLVRYIYDGCKG